jgi:MATE family multidrug resistance protein
MDIINGLATSSLTMITQEFVGHIDDLELAMFSLVVGLILRFDYGILMGIGNVLGTLCGQTFGPNQHHMLKIYLQRSWIVLLRFAVLLFLVFLFITPILRFLG